MPLYPERFPFKTQVLQNFDRVCIILNISHRHSSYLNEIFNVIFRCMSNVEIKLLILVDGLALTFETLIPFLNG